MTLFAEQTKETFERTWQTKRIPLKMYDVLNFLFDLSHRLVSLAKNDM